MSPTRKLLMALAVLVPLGLFFGAANTKGFFSEEAAAWAQAIGTVLAIAAAIWTAQSSTRVAVRIASETTYNQTLAIVMIFSQVRAVITESEKRRSTPPGFDPANLDAIVDAMNSLPILELPAGRFALEVVQARRSLHFYRQALGLQLEHYDKPTPLPPIVENELRTHAAELLRLVDRTEVAANALAEALDRRWASEFGDEPRPLH